MHGKPDIMLVHSDLPDDEVAEVLAGIRNASRAPLLVISSRDTVAARVAALNAGADDCMVWPCDIVEILARLRAIRRRLEREPEEPHLKCGALKMDLIARLVTVKGAEVHLTPIEYGVLRLLAIQSGKVITQRQLLREIWGTESEAQSRHLRVHLSNMRRKLAAAGFDTRSLRNEPGVGYRLVSPV